MKLKQQFKHSLHKVKVNEFENDKFKQAIITVHDNDADIKTYSKAYRRVRRHMIFKNFLYILKLSTISLFALALGIQPYIMTNQFTNTVLHIPYKHISTGDVLQIQLNAEGKYVMSAAIFGVVLFWVLIRPWGKAPYRKVTVKEFVEKQYPKIQKEAEKLSHK